MSAKNRLDCVRRSVLAEEPRLYTRSASTRRSGSRGFSPSDPVIQGSCSPSAWRAAFVTNTLHGQATVVSGTAVRPPAFEVLACPKPSTFSGCVASLREPALPRSPRLVAVTRDRGQPAPSPQAPSDDSYVESDLSVGASAPASPEDRITAWPYKKAENDQDNAEDD